VNAYEVKALRCNLQVTLCDPYLSALSVRYYNKGGGHTPEGALAGCSSPFHRPLSPYRWINHYCL